MRTQREIKITKKIALAVFCLLLIPAVGRAEITGTDPLNDLDLDPGANDPLPTAQTVQTNGAEGEVLENVVFNQTGPTLDMNQVQANDVACKFGNCSNGAANHAGIGMAAAIATGASLMAAGVPMSGSPIASVRAAGIALIAKAVLEFAQAAASGAAQSANGNTETKILRANEANEEGQAAQANVKSGKSPEEIQNDIAGRIDTPELRDLLSSRGVNADDFIGQIASGTIRDPNDIARALGDLTDFSDADLAKGNELADAKLNETLETSKITLDEDNAKFGMGNLAAANLGAAGGLDEFSDINMDRLLGKGSGSGASLGDLARSLIKGGNGGNSAADLNKLLAGVSKRKAGDGENPGLSGLTLNELLGLGIHRLRPGMNIFQKASRSYKSFDRWRKKATRLAQVP